MRFVGRAARPGAALACATIVALSVGGAAQEQTLEQVLALTGAYVTNLHQQLSGIVAEETYVQRSVSRRVIMGRPFLLDRTLKSDLLLVRLPGADDYVEFRDVFEVDGKPVRDREERLTKLFLQPPASRAAQLDEIAQESSRYNIGGILRSINTPLLALAFLAPGMQPRVQFHRVQHEQPKLTADLAVPVPTRDAFAVPPEAWTIAFKEQQRPTFIRRKAGGDFAASGRFWIDVSTGTVLVSELVMYNNSISATIVVSYQSEPLLGFRVPMAMYERYRLESESIDGLASYGRFRQFQVTTSEAIGKPPSPPS